MTFQDIIKRGLELGLEAVELYITNSESNTIKLDEGKLESYNSKDLFGISIRGLYQGKMSYVYTETVDDVEMEKVLNKLVENVKLIDATEPEFMFEGGSTYQAVPELVSDYQTHSTNEKIVMLQNLEKEALLVSDKIKKVGYCQYSEHLSKVQIMNSKGLNLSRKYAYLTTALGVLAKEEDQTVMGYSGDVQANFANLETTRMVDEATKRALSQLGAGAVQSGNYSVVLSRDVATEILSAFSSVFSGDSAMKKMTILTDKIGQKIFGENITLIDDPFYQDAIIQIPFDDEGVPCYTKKIVENGIFKGFAHNLKTANFFHTTSTGNGFKAGTSGSVSVAPTNLFIQEGSISKDEIIAKTNEGVMITEVNGLHAGLNPISGNFNVQASGFIIKDGKLDRPITLFVLSGNFYEMMNNVEEIGNDIEKRFVGVASPTLKIKSLAISGK